MATKIVEVDRTKPVKFNSDERSIPVRVYGENAVAIFSEEDYAKLMRMVQTIKTKRTEYTEFDAIEWSAMRAVEMGNLLNGVLRVGREHVQ